MKRSYLYIFFLLLFALTSVYPQTIPSSIRRELAQRETRYHHFLWHNIRNLWNRMDSETQDAIRRNGWAPPRPAQRFTSGGTAVAIENNLSGEDFLFMHRQMYRRVGVISGWSTIPGPGEGPSVPPSYTGTNSEMTNSIRNFKSSNFYTNSIAPRERRFRDPDYLRTVTLGQLGAQIEFTIHNWIHIRWSARNSLGLRVRVNSDPVPDVDERWDNPAYDWLIDPYGSHLNPFFYRIHGWVDARVEDWRRANGLGSVNWRGRWTGGPMSNLDDMIEDAQDVRGRLLRGVSDDNGDEKGMDMGHDAGSKKMSMEVMEEVAKILFKTGLESNFYDKVLLEEDLPEYERLERKKSKAKRKSKCKSKKRRV